MEILTYGKKDNPCIVFLHGWGGGFSSFSFFAKALSDKFFTIVVDFNSTLFKDEIISLDDVADELADKLDLLNVNDITIIGHSFGGRVAAVYYGKNTKKVKKIVLIDSAGLRPRRSLWYYIKVKWFKFNVSLAKLGIISKTRLKEFGSPDYKKLTLNERQTFKNIVNRDLASQFAKIKCPTLIYWGTLDRETPLYMAKKLNKLITNSAVVKINGAGHFSYAERPGQFISVIRAFMEKDDD